MPGRRERENCVSVSELPVLFAIKLPAMMKHLDVPIMPGAKRGRMADDQPQACPHDRGAVAGRLYQILIHARQSDWAIRFV
jgi:hypothetical protein